MIRRSNVVKIFDGEIELPEVDNTAGALKVYRAANERFRQVPWPRPFDETTHSLSLSFGEIVPNVPPIIEAGYVVKRGPIATIEIGIEVKIIQKATIDRLIA